MILPNQKTLGILGGGQLGQMFAFAARRMGYQVICYEPAAHCPADSITEHISATFEDETLLARFVEKCDAITLEFENIPVQAVQFLEQHCPVHPSSYALTVAQNRASEKNHLHHIGLPTVRFVNINQVEDLPQAWADIAGPSILKISTLGYDGKGQLPVNNSQELAAAFAQLNHRPCILEQKVTLEKEISVIFCRNADGQHAVFPIAENIHVDGILTTTIAPARISAEIAQQAIDMTRNLAESLNYIGVLSVEFFLTDSQQLLINEIAPRPHNSGHYTIDACVTSQFQQQVRMTCGLPPGATRQHTPAVMKNLLGDLWGAHPPAWEQLLNQPNAHLHLYSKDTPRPRRKMGHFTCLDDDLEQALAQADALMRALEQHP